VLTDSAVIAPKAEPGTPLHLSGQLFHKDGKTPASGIIVQAYQTDAAGHYLNSGDATWRLQGWVRTNGDGRFTFDTIHPGAYPSRTTAAHIHLQAEGRGVVRQSLETIYFEGDPLLTPKDIADSERLAPFRTIWPVRRTANGEACDIRLRVAEIFVF
jgi:protocatechuate 3,4-dioxygenase beta subunit